MTEPTTLSATTHCEVRVDRDRLWASLMELKEIGAYDDEATGLRGVRRLALTDADAEAAAAACSG
jgi:N-carbamoyl-L-amino-acid hydrolase